MVIARLKGEVIAESVETVLVDGRHYFPPGCVQAEMLRPTAIRGDLYYYSVIVGGRPTPDCAYQVISDDPRNARIAHHIAFLGPVEVTVEATRTVIIGRR